MNLVLGNVEETKTGLPEDPESTEGAKTAKRTFGMLFVRGDSIVLAAPIRK